jgi:hypothetical protein
MAQSKEMIVRSLRVNQPLPDTTVIARSDLCDEAIYIYNNCSSEDRLLRQNPFRNDKIAGLLSAKPGTI